MERLKWYLKQLFPLTYVATYSVSGKWRRRKLCVWNMWFGRCFNVRYFDLAGP